MKESVCAFKGIRSRTFSMQKGRTRKGRSHKQEYKETQTWLTSGKGGSNETQTWSVTLIDDGMFISVRLSDQRSCQMGYQEKMGRHKQNTETQTWLARQETKTRNKLALKKLQAHWDFATDKDANLRVQNVGKASVELCTIMKECAGEGLLEEQRKNGQNRV